MVSVGVLVAATCHQTWYKWVVSEVTFQMYSSNLYNEQY